MCMGANLEGRSSTGMSTILASGGGLRGGTTAGTPSPAARSPWGPVLPSSGEPKRLRRVLFRVGSALLSPAPRKIGEGARARARLTDVRYRQRAYGTCTAKRESMIKGQVRVTRGPVGGLLGTHCRKNYSCCKRQGGARARESQVNEGSLKGNTASLAGIQTKLQMAAAVGDSSEWGDSA